MHWTKSTIQIMLRMDILNIILQFTKCEETNKKVLYGTNDPIESEFCQCMTGKTSVMPFVY